MRKGERPQSDRLSFSRRLAMNFFDLICKFYYTRGAHRNLMLRMGVLRAIIYKALNLFSLLGLEVIV